MAKEKQTEQQTWADRMKEFGAGDFTFLSSDGEAMTFIVVGLPELLKSKYQGKEQERIGCPIVTEDGYQLLVCGKRLARKLSKQHRKFDTNALMVIRHGAEGDTNTRYELRVLDDEAVFKRLQEVKAEDFTPDMVAESVKEAQKVMQN